MELPGEDRSRASIGNPTEGHHEDRTDSRMGRLVALAFFFRGAAIARTYHRYSSPRFSGKRPGPTPVVTLPLWAIFRVSTPEASGPIPLWRG